jgi:hypothetical protein
MTSAALLLVPSLLFLVAAPALDPGQDPAQEYWTDLAATLTARHSVRDAIPADPIGERLRQDLAATRLPGLTGIEDEPSLAGVIDVVRTVSGLPMVVDPRVEQFVMAEGLTFSFNMPYPLSVEEALNIITEQAGEQVSWTVRHGAVLVTSRESTRRKPMVFLHLVADLAAFFEPEDVATLVMENVAPGSWDVEGALMEVRGPFLLVANEPAAQLGIEAFLGDLRAFQASLSKPPTFEPSEGELALDATLARLESVYFSPDFNHLPIDEVALQLQQLTGLNFLVSSPLRDELESVGARIDLALGETNVRVALDLIGDVCPELAWTVMDGVVKLQTQDEQRLGMRLALYDVRDIVGPGALEFTLSHTIHGSDDLEPMVLDPDALESMIRYQVSPASWDANPAASLRISPSGLMFVTQSPPVQAEVRALLVNLQTVADLMHEVQARHPVQR